VAFARPACELTVLGQTWYVRADFPVAYQELALAELAGLHGEYHAGRIADGELTAGDAEDHTAMVELAARVRDAAQTLPTLFWEPAPGQFVANARDAGAPPRDTLVQDESDEDSDAAEEEEDSEEEDESEEEEDVSAMDMSA